MTRIWDRIKSTQSAPKPLHEGDAYDLHARLASLELTGYHRRFLVNRLGSTGSTWLAKLLNSDPDVFCYHEGVLTQIFPATSYTSADVTNFIRSLATDDMHDAYRAVGDVGSVWIGHIVALPKGLFTTGMLLRHPARMLNTRLTVFKSDKSFTEIDPQCLRHIEETWSIKAATRSQMDQIFLQDLFHLSNQIKAIDAVDVIIQLERMRDVDYCCEILRRLTHLDPDRSLVQLFIDNPINRRTSGHVSLKEILDGFSGEQRAWYRTVLEPNLPQCGYALEDDDVIGLPSRRAIVADERSTRPVAERSRLSELTPSADLRADIPDLRTQLAGLQLRHRSFLVTRIGSSGSTWLAKLLNSHPEVLCYHEGVAQLCPSAPYTSDDVAAFIRWLFKSMHGAYRAVGDVGSVGMRQIHALPTGLFTTGALLEHPARILHARLKVPKTDQSFTRIDPQDLRSIEDTWGINASTRDEVDQIFLQDLFRICNQVKSLDGLDVVIQLERMSDVEYCCGVLHRLTDLHHEPSVVHLSMNNPVNHLTSANVSVKGILGRFSSDQRAWYRMALEDTLLQHGYALEDDECVGPPGRPPAVATSARSRNTVADEAQTLKQIIADQDRQLAHLQGIWTAVQNSAGWRVLNKWRRLRSLVLPMGTRRRRYYDWALRLLRRTRTP